MDINNSAQFNSVWLDGFLKALSIVDNGLISASVRFCDLDEQNVALSFEESFNKTTEDEIEVDDKLKLETALQVKNWIGWLQDYIEEFLLSNIESNSTEKRFNSTSDQKAYLIWQIMEMVCFISNEFESDFIYVSNARIGGSIGKYIFIPSDDKFLVISLMTYK